jgi:ATP-binding cassette subfamily B protein
MMGVQDFRGLGFGAGNGGRGNRWSMRELVKDEHLDWVIFKRALREYVPYWPNVIIVTLVIFATSIVYCQLG